MERAAFTFTDGEEHARCVLISVQRSAKIVNIPALILGLFLALSLSAQQGSTPSQDASPLPSAPSQAADSVFAGARKLVQQGKSSEAIAELQRLGVENPNLLGLAHELGITYYKAGDYLKAIDAFKKATQEDPADKEALQLLGLSNYLAGRPADAIPLLEKVQGWYPRANVDASYILGVCYIQTKDYPKARVAFARMFDVPADSAAAYLFTARMLLRQEFDPIAEEYARKAIELDPKLPLAHFFLGELHLYKSRIPEAIADFEAELKLNPGHAKRTTNWRTLIRGCRSSTKRSVCCSGRSGSIRRRLALIFCWARCSRKKARRNWRRGLCSTR